MELQASEEQRRKTNDTEQSIKDFISTCNSNSNDGNNLYLFKIDTSLLFFKNDIKIYSNENLEEEEEILHQRKKANTLPRQNYQLENFQKIEKFAYINEQINISNVGPNINFKQIRKNNKTYEEKIFFKKHIQIKQKTEVRFLI